MSNFSYRGVGGIRIGFATNENKRRENNNLSSRATASKNSDFSLLSNLSRGTTASNQSQDYFSRAMHESLGQTSRRSALSESNRMDSGIDFQVSAESRESIAVHSCEEAEGEWVYTVEVKFRERQNQMLFRSLKDFWDLHLHLSRDQNQDRVLPYMDPIPEDITQTIALHRRFALQFYLNEISNSNYLDRIKVNQFFWPTQSDCVINDDLSNSLARISRIHKPKQIFKIIDISETVEWAEEGILTKGNLLTRANSLLKNKIHALFYINEFNERKELTHDYELYLIINGKELLEFYTSINF